jgi:hypothetical protein
MSRLLQHKAQETAQSNRHASVKQQANNEKLVLYYRLDLLEHII